MRKNENTAFPWDKEFKNEHAPEKPKQYTISISLGGTIKNSEGNTCKTEFDMSIFSTKENLEENISNLEKYLKKCLFNKICEFTKKEDQKVEVKYELPEESKEQFNRDNLISHGLTEGFTLDIGNYEFIRYGFYMKSFFPAEDFDKESKFIKDFVFSTIKDKEVNAINLVQDDDGFVQWIFGEKKQKHVKVVKKGAKKSLAGNPGDYEMDFGKFKGLKIKEADLLAISSYYHSFLVKAENPSYKLNQAKKHIALYLEEDEVKEKLEEINKNFQTVDKNFDKYVAIDARDTLRKEYEEQQGIPEIDPDDIPF